MLTLDLGMPPVFEHGYLPVAAELLLVSVDAAGVTTFFAKAHACDDVMPYQKLSKLVRIGNNSSKFKKLQGATTARTRHVSTD